jgi:hypothetical protein
MTHPLFEDLEDANLILRMYFKYSFAFDGHLSSNIHSGKYANLSIDAQNATDNTPLSNAKIKQNEEKTGLYNLGYSPLSTIMIENCLEDYPDFKTKQELIGGLKFDFKLEYTGPRIPTIFAPDSGVLSVAF